MAFRIRWWNEEIQDGQLFCEAGHWNAVPEHGGSTARPLP